MGSPAVAAEASRVRATEATDNSIPRATFLSHIFVPLQFSPHAAQPFNAFLAFFLVEVFRWRRDVARRFTDHARCVCVWFMSSAVPAGDGQDPIVWERTRGGNVWDVDGNRFVDLTAGFGVVAAGHCNPFVVARAEKQMRTHLHGMGDAFPGRCVRWPVSLLPLSRVALWNPSHLKFACQLGKSFLKRAR